MELSSDIVARIKAIRLVAFDFDGVFTDNRVLVSEDGTESVLCNRSDGIGLARLRQAGVACLIISTEPNPVVALRAQKLGVPCCHGVDDKLPVLRHEAEKLKVPLEDAAFVGNDVNDAECLKAVGLPVVVADAWDQVKGLAALVLTRPGGHGAVRELCEIVVVNKTGLLREEV